MKWLLLLVVALVVLVAAVAAIGAMLPRTHVASRSLRVARPPAEVWTLIADFAAAPTWRAGVTQMERAPDRDGRPVWIEHGSNGPLAAKVVESTPPRRLVTEIVDSSMFGGTWTFDVVAEGAGAMLTITERGFVGNPVFRFLSKYAFGHHATMDAYLTSVAKRFGEPAALFGE